MPKSNVIVLLVLRALFIGTAVSALFSTAQAQSRVGVAQSIQNNPVGKPPGGVDRVLRVGTDVQANEIISTAADDRAHLVFIDGTTLTIGPSSSMTIDKFVYDPTTQKGELAVNATKGIFRVIGGRISKTAEITVSTPSSTIGIRGGIMIVGVEATQTTSIFVYGNSMTVTANGATQTVTQPGLQVTTIAGSPPGAPTIVVQGSLSAALGNLAGNNAAAAALLSAINTLVANNFDNAAVLATLTSLIQGIINQNAPSTIGTTNTSLSILAIPDGLTEPPRRGGAGYSTRNDDIVPPCAVNSRLWAFGPQQGATVGTPSRSRGCWPSEQLARQTHQHPPLAGDLIVAPRRSVWGQANAESGQREDNPAREVVRLIPHPSKALTAFQA